MTDIIHSDTIEQARIKCENLLKNFDFHNMSEDNLKSYMVNLGKNLGHYVFIRNTK